MNYQQREIKELKDELGWRDFRNIDTPYLVKTCIKLCEAIESLFEIVKDLPSEDLQDSSDTGSS